MGHPVHIDLRFASINKFFLLLFSQIDHVEQLLQLQLSLIKQLVEQK